MREEFGDARHLPDEDRIPAFEKLCRRQIDAERVVQMRKECVVGNLAALVSHIDVAARKPAHDVVRCTLRVVRPDLQHAREIDIQHDAAEIKQQGVCGIWRKQHRHLYLLAQRLNMCGAG
jgi:hypothetical protein